MKTKKTKRKSVKIRWKLFFAVLIPTLFLIAFLWVLQTIFLGVFYSNVKADELEKTANNVISNLNSDDIGDRILFLSSNGDINIRIIETAEFDTLYSTGEQFDSVTYGWGVVGMFKLYEQTKEDGGELVRYYSDAENAQTFEENAEIVPAPEINLSPSKEEREEFSQEDMREFRSRFEAVPRPRMFENIGRHNDLLYSKITVLEDGTEIMVVADTRISPLDSTVKALKYQLITCSVVAIIITLIVSYVLSKRIAKPIENLNKSARQLAGRDGNLTFDGKGYREIEELSDTLNYASKELDKVQTLQHELLANVSHDMRTPLTMIVGYGEMMRDIPGENNGENIQLVIDEAKRLSEFVTNVLDLSKLESGMETLDEEKVNITLLLKNCVERYIGLLPESKLDIKLVADEQVFVMCDEAKMTQAVYNLVDNAINYAKEPKKVVIRQRISNDNVRLEFCDNGDGIEAEKLPYIWDRYYRGDKNHKRNIVGSGIGLSIVKRIFMLHGFRYGVETKIGEGSIFWIEMKKI